MKWQKQGLEKLRGWGCTPELAGPSRKLLVLKRKGNQRNNGMRESHDRANE